MKPYSKSCDQNCEPIFDVIQKLFAKKKHVLEIGSGTGQHAVFFAKKMPHLIWQCSDQKSYHEGINQWINEAWLDNIRSPISLNVSNDDWPKLEIDAIFSANTLHIMSWDNMKDFIRYAANMLPNKGLLVIYGPFNYNNQYTSESNAHFDIWLKQKDPKSSIRNFEDVNELAKQAGLLLQNDCAMPANNRILCWEKQKNPFTNYS